MVHAPERSSSFTRRPLPAPPTDPYARDQAISSSSRSRVFASFITRGRSKRLQAATFLFMPDQCQPQGNGKNAFALSSAWISPVFYSPAAQTAEAEEQIHLQLLPGSRRTTLLPVRGRRPTRELQRELSSAPGACSQASCLQCCASVDAVGADAFLWNKTRQEISKVPTGGSLVCRGGSSSRCLRWLPSDTWGAIARRGNAE